MLILSRDDLERLLSPPAVIEALAAAFRLAAAGRAAVPPRSAVPAGGDNIVLLMPATAHDGGASHAGVKVVSVYPGNRARGHPTIYASYLLLDGATGQPLALLDGRYLTGLRTGATSALAARLLARPDARRVACFGAGVQAGFQLLALAADRSLERITVIGRDPARTRGFAETMATRLALPVEVADDPRIAVRRADIVTCATTSATPVVFGADLKPGTHLDLVGAFRPSDREADSEALRRSRLVVDTYEGALSEAGDVLLAMKDGVLDRGHIAAELAELVTGRRPGRTAADEITVFKSVGWALEDLATATLAYTRARTAGGGVEVGL